MTEKSNRPLSSTMWSSKPVPMKLFGAWEIDKTPSNCIPRLCTLTITRLVLLKSLGPDVTTMMIAVKMQSSKRTLRSNEITVPNVSEHPNGVLDVELDLTFSLQYPHFLKRSGNQLQILLQRRKKYKNRAILGFKTLAGGIINMAEVLQRSGFMDKELELLGNTKELQKCKNEAVARIVMSTLKSQPVDQEGSINGRHVKMHGSLDRSADVDSDDDDDFTSAEEGSDSEAIEDTGAVSGAGASTRDRLSQWRRQVNGRKGRKLFSASNVGSDSTNAQQRNFKQKFIALLKKFRVPDSEGFDSEEQYQAALEQELIAQNSGDIEDLFEEEDGDVDDLSDSGQEFDDVSISSTPKPSLRPFFSSCTLVGPDAESNTVGHMRRIEPEIADTEQTPDTSDTSLKQQFSEEQTTKRLHSAEKDKEKKSKLFNREKHTPSNVTSKDKEKKSGGNNTPLTKERSLSNPIKDSESSPRKSVLEQLNRIFSTDDSSIPDQFLLVHGDQPLAQHIAQQLQDRQLWVVSVFGSADIKASFTCLINKIQKFCNCNSRAPSPIKVAIVGSDGFVNAVLRVYVESLSSKPPEWQNYIRFYIVPLSTGQSSIAKYLGSIDSTYYLNFCNGSWKDLLDDYTSLAKLHDILQRIVSLLNGANIIFQVPIAEAMVTYKEKSQDDESLQVFIPFICDVRISMMEAVGGSHSIDFDEKESQNLSSSPPQTSLNNSHTEKSLPLTSPMSTTKDRDQQVLQQTTPPSSPSITMNLSGASQFISAGAQSQISTNQGSQSGSLPSDLKQILSGGTTTSFNISSESMDLQIDYWPMAVKSNEGSKKVDSSKFTLKNTFRSLSVSRLPNLGEVNSPSLTLSYMTKEKKQKIMRLGKKKEKEKDPESKSAKNQVAEGIHRLVCSSKTSQAPLKVTIDGVEWYGVKFFQLTAQWQTHIKYFPVALFISHNQFESKNRVNTSNSSSLS